MTSRTRSRIGLCLVVLTALAYNSASTSATPIDNAEHPRLWLSSQTLPGIRTRLATSLSSDFQAFVRYLDSEYDLASTESDYYFHIRNFAFLYAVGPIAGITYGHTQASYGNKAAELLRRFAISSDGPSSEGDAVVHLLTAGYDWCFPLLTATD